ncbi:MAG TPA: lipoprotein signal peptidase, partial [Flavobacteriales bacterium]|nr:lipoprotein signal peptidase [Flavobacteriales bacterium]
DQALKLWVKLSFYYDSAVPLFGDWGYLHFIENRGMAFGMEFGGVWGKLLLTLFRIAAVAGIGWYLLKLVKRNVGLGLLISVALIFSGALGNIIDSTFYGLIFSESTPFQKAVLFPAEGGYAPLFHGAVVDMFYFPIWEGRLPEWLPVWGGEHTVFFRPVFNVADAAITVGVALFILVQRNSNRKQLVDGPSETPTAMTPEPEAPMVPSETPPA